MTEAIRSETDFLARLALPPYDDPNEMISRVYGK